MSHYADYILERTNDKIIETDFGWATYRYIKQAVYIIDIYVVPQKRKNGIAAYMADLIAEEAKKEFGCTEMLGTVVPSTKHSTTSLKVLLAYGMELHSATADLIVFRKEI